MNSEPVVTLLSRGESKVCYLELILLVEQEVFGLQVSMHDSSRVVQILDGAEQLEEVVASKALVEAALFVLHLNEREEVTLLDKLEHDEEHLRSLAVRFDENLPLAVVFNEFDDVWVVHGLDQTDLVLEYFLECLQVNTFYFVPLYDLNRIEPRRILKALGQLDSKGVTRTGLTWSRSLCRWS